jgi:hypothetical protein
MSFIRNLTRIFFAWKKVDPVLHVYVLYNSSYLYDCLCLFSLFNYIPVDLHVYVVFYCHKGTYHYFALYKDKVIGLETEHSPNKVYSYIWCYR